MGVMECDRAGCRNVMCTRLIVNGRYYICDSCWSELQQYKKLIQNNTDVCDLVKRIEEFMDTKPNNFYGETFDEVWDKLTCPEYGSYD